jgi:hypothetical protein
MKLGPFKQVLGRKTIVWGTGLALLVGGSVGMRGLVGSVHESPRMKGSTISTETVDPEAAKPERAAPAYISSRGDVAPGLLV